MPDPNKTPPHNAASGSNTVTVSAPARLHLGFIDLHGGLGRRYGSFGLSLDQPQTILSLRRAERPAASGPDATRALRYAAVLAAKLTLPGAVDIRVQQAIPAHAGLGSGTQLALATGVALARLYRRELSPTEIAALLERGARSGIGVGAFEHGGFLVDGGHKTSRDGVSTTTEVPPLLCRLPVPESWRLLLLFDDAERGVHGGAERYAFNALPPFSEALAGRLSRLVLMQVLPALADADIDMFGCGVSDVQRLVGDYFAPHQGGRRFTSERVAAALAWLLANGAAGGGQSSWGPTGFALCAEPSLGEHLLAQTRARYPQLRPLLCRPNNQPAEIHTTPARGNQQQPLVKQP